MMPLIRHHRFSLPIFGLLVSLLVVAGCDQSQGLTGPDSVASESDATDRSTNASATKEEGTLITISSPAELKDQLSEVSTPIAGSRELVFGDEKSVRVVMGTGFFESPASGAPQQLSSKQVGPFKRKPLMFTFNDNVKFTDLESVDSQSTFESKNSSGDPSPNTICINPGDPNCDDPPPPPPPPCDDCGGYDPPNIQGNSGFDKDDFLHKGSAIGLATTTASRPVEEIFASPLVSIDVNNGAYQDQISTSSTDMNSSSVQVGIGRDNYAGEVDLVSEGSHSVVDNNGDYQNSLSPTSASAETNFAVPNSNCSPLPTFYDGIGEDGETYGDEEIRVHWQIICPQKATNYFQIRRLSGDGGPASSAEVASTGHAGWHFNTLTSFYGLYLGNGDYEWRVRAEGESTARTGTFSIDAEPPACQKPIVGAELNGDDVDVVVDAGCLDLPGSFTFRFTGVAIDGSIGASTTVTATIQGDGGDGNLTIPIPEPNAVDGYIVRYVALMDGSTTRDEVKYYDGRGISIMPIAN